MLSVARHILISCISLLIKFSPVLSQYLFKVAGSTPGPWQLKGVAVAGYTVATLGEPTCNSEARSFPTY